MHAFPDASHALTHAWHLAVVAGSDTGWSVGVPPRWTTVGRDGATVPLSDDLVSRAHLQIRHRPGRRRPVAARDLGSTNGTRVARPRRPRPDGTPRWHRERRLGGMPRALPEGSRLRCGSTVIEVRARPGVAPPEEQPAGRSRGHGAEAVLLRLLPVLLTSAMILPLMLRGGSPWRFLWLAVPVLTLSVVLLPLLRRGGTGPRPTDPAALLLDVARGVRAVDGASGTRAWAPPSRPGVPEMPQAPVALPWHLPGEPAALLHPGQSLGVCGPGAEAAARWFAVRAWAACPPGGCTVTGAVESAEGWAPGGPGGPAGGWHVDLRTALPPAPRPALRPVLPPARDALVPASAAADVSAVPVAPGPLGASGEDGSSAVTIVVARHRRHLPAWCTHVVEVGPRADLPSGAWARAVLADRGRDAEPMRAAAGVGDLLGTDLADALRRNGPRAAGAVRRSWARPPGRSPSLAVPLGIDPRTGAAVRVDLLADGPHALVAGTTGSGKSEALVTWALTLALAHSPDDLQFLLLDHKGGATFAPLAGLPHVAGLLTDLDAAATDRAVNSLTAELRRRERLLASAGVRDLAELELNGRPRFPRLVVMADEFRVLADAHPDLMDGLRRIAAQGRTLGIHLVLATQRPAGAIGPDLRANVPLRLCLRVLEDADSTDVLGTPDAARLPATPGTALLRAATTRRLQVAWSGDGAWAAGVVEACRAARRADPAPLPPRPWAPDLPTLVESAEVGRTALGLHHGLRGGDVTASAAGRLPLGLADLPAEQRLAPADVDAARGLLVLGDPGTGRTTCLRTLLGAALADGWDTHVLTAGPWPSPLDGGSERPSSAPGAAPGFPGAPPAHVRGGTWLAAHDARRARRLLDLLSGPGAVRAGRRTLCVIDDAEAVADLLDAGVRPGTGAELLERLVRDASRAGLAVVVAGGPGLASARWVAPLRTRLVLGLRDETLAAMCGVPARLRGAARCPGRGVLLDGSATVVQVAQPPDLPTTRSRSSPSPVPQLPDQLPDQLPVLDLLPLPEVITPEAWSRACTGVRAPALVAAIGGDRAEPLIAPADASHPWAVVGGPASGRTTALRALAAAAAAQGRSVTVWDAAADMAPPGTSAAAPTPAVPAAPEIPPGGLLLVDNLHPAAAVRLEAALAGTGPDVGVVLTAAEHQVGPHATGLLARVQASGTLIVLDPARSALREVRPALEPGRRHVVVVSRGSAQPAVLPNLPALPAISVPQVAPGTAAISGR